MRIQRQPVSAKVIIHASDEKSTKKKKKSNLREVVTAIIPVLVGAFITMVGTFYSSIYTSRRENREAKRLHEVQVFQKRLMVAEKLYAFYSQFSLYDIDVSKSLYNDSAVTSLGFSVSCYLPDSLIQDFRTMIGSDYEPLHESVLSISKYDPTIDPKRQPMDQQLLLRIYNRRLKVESYASQLVKSQGE